MKLQKLVCVAAAVLMLAACDRGGTETEKDKQLEQQLIARLQTTITEVDSVSAAHIAVTTSKETGKTVEVSVTPDAGKSITPEEKASIQKLVENSFNETAKIILTENPNAEAAVEDSAAAPEKTLETPAKPMSSFLRKAYNMGYTDKQLALLNESGCTEDNILNLTQDPSIDMDFNEGYTPDGRYTLDGYFVSGGGEGLCACMYLKDTQTGEVAILSDWQNGYSQFGFLNNERFFTAIAQVGGADYEAGIRFYDVEHPEKPASIWALTDSAADADSDKVKTLLGTYPVNASERLVAFWCETPKKWGGWVLDDSETYRAAILDYNGKVIKLADTGVKLAQSNLGVAYPNCEKPNAMIEPRENTIYFDVGEQAYMLDLASGVTALFSR